MGAVACLWGKNNLGFSLGMEMRLGCMWARMRRCSALCEFRICMNRKQAWKGKRGIEVCQDGKLKYVIK